MRVERVQFVGALVMMLSLFELPPIHCDLPIYEVAPTLGRIDRQRPLRHFRDFICVDGIGIPGRQAQLHQSKPGECERVVGIKCKGFLKQFQRGFGRVRIDCTRGVDAPEEKVVGFHVLGPLPARRGRTLAFELAGE